MGQLALNKEIWYEMLHLRVWNIRKSQVRESWNLVPPEERAVEETLTLNTEPYSGRPASYTVVQEVWRTHFNS